MVSDILAAMASERTPVGVDPEDLVRMAFHCCAHARDVEDAVELMEALGVGRVHAETALRAIRGLPPLPEWKIVAERRGNGVPRRRHGTGRFND